jgi:SWI/SNF-related matrix-associated actin-dependent regulator of chromatin subfamily B member 1
MPYRSNFSVNDLVPVSLDIEIDGQKYKENFCWNVNEPYLTPENFSKLVVDENSLDQNVEREISSFPALFV